MSEKKAVGKVAFEYCAKYPQVPSQTIARMLLKEHPKLFSSLNQARHIIRYYRGQQGEKSRSRNNDKTHWRKAGSVFDGCIPLPEPITEVLPWSVCKLRFNRALVLPDLHIPFQDNQAILAAIKHGKHLGVDCVILAGDMMDFYGISSWEKNPELRIDLSDEVQLGQQFLAWLRQQFPKARIVYLEGNHEERLWRHLWQKNPQVYNLKDSDGKRLLGLEVVMGLSEWGIELVADRRPILCGEHLYLLHGHEWKVPMMTPVNPARTLFLRVHANAICGHLHQKSEHSEKSVDRVVSCWSMGCLCGLHPKYMPLNKWSTGFSVIELSKAEWQVNNLKIIKGQIV